MQGILCVTEREEGDAPYALLWVALQGQDGTEGLWGKEDHESPSESPLLAHCIPGDREDRTSCPAAVCSPHLQPGPGAG